MKTLKIFITLLMLVAISFAQNEERIGGKILFSKEPISNENDPGITNSFTQNDYIYALVILKDLAKNFWSYPIKAEDFQLVFEFLDEKPTNLYYTNGRIKGAELEKSIISLEILPNPSKMVSYNPDNPISFKRFGVNDQGSDGPIGISLRMKSLPPGKQRVLVKFNLNYSEAAKGEFEITSSDFRMFDQVAKNLIDGANKTALKSAKMPEAKKVDKDLENKMIQAIMNSNDWKTGFIKGKSIVKLVIIDPDWEIRRNQVTGAILHRYIRAAAAIKGPDNKCRVYNLFTFQQDYVGGKFQPLKYDGVGDNYEIDCDKIK